MEDFNVQKKIVDLSSSGQGGIVTGIIKKGYLVSGKLSKVSAWSGPRAISL